MGRTKERSANVAKGYLGSPANVAMSVFNRVTVLASWAFTKSFNLCIWVSSKPHTAYFALLAMRKYKDSMCSKAGEYIAGLGIKLDRKATLDAFICKTTGVAPPADSTLSYLMNACYELAKLGMNVFLGKFGGEIASATISGGGNKLGRLLGTGLGGIPLFGCDRGRAPI